MNTERRLYGTVELRTLLGITDRRIQYWDESRLVRAHTVSHRRHYDYDAALALALTAELRRKGVPLQTVRKLLPKARKFWTKRGVTGFLLVAGEQFYLSATRDDCFSMALLSRLPVHIVDMGALRERLGEGRT